MQMAVILPVHGIDGTGEGNDLEHTVKVVAHKFSLVQVINSHIHVAEGAQGADAG